MMYRLKSWSINNSLRSESTTPLYVPLQPQSAITESTSLVTFLRHCHLIIPYIRTTAQYFDRYDSVDAPQQVSAVAERVNKKP